MKLRQLLITALAVGCASSAGAQTYTDVTSAYLLNAGFDGTPDYAVGDTGNVEADNIIGPSYWTLMSTTNVGIVGTFQLGTAKTFNGSAVPATGADGETDGGVLGINFQAGKSFLYQQFAALPAGNYQLVLAIYNPTELTRATHLITWRPYPTGKASRKQGTTLYANSWTTDTCSFTVDSVTYGRVQFSIGGSQVSHPDVALDFVKLLRQEPLGDADLQLRKDSLAAVIAEAQGLYVDGESSAVVELQRAVISAQTVLDGASVDHLPQMLQAQADLRDAISAFQFTSNVVVTTDTRYARGATMAFGRMTVSGTTDIAGQGYVAGTEPHPTVDSGILSNETLSNNGSIYCLSGLTPATKYYMRPYVKSSKGFVAYGSDIMFYTIPKGQITYNIRSSSSADDDARITKAVKGAVDIWNNLTEIKSFNTSVGYNSGTPTAECSYGGWMSVGSNQSYQSIGTIMHEMLHGVGVIPWAGTQWSVVGVLRTGSQSVSGGTYGSGNWLGERVSAVLDFWDNTTGSYLHGDYQHMWPYGCNGASEDTHSNVLYYGNGLICQALGEDGLEHTSSHYAEPYYSKDITDGTKYYITTENADYGRYAKYLFDRGGSLTTRELTADQLEANDSAAWVLTFTPDNQYYQFKNVATGRYLNYNGSFNTVSTTAPGSLQDFQLMRGRVDAGQTGVRGYWITRHAARNPYTLNVSSTGAVNSATFDLRNTATAQRWVILDPEEMKQYNNATTGIREVTVSDDASLSEKTSATGVYTLGGQLVRRNTNSVEGLPKGIYIVGGHKVVVR